MNDHEIEKLLRKSQDPQPPPELLKSLLSDIPRPPNSRRVHQSTPNWLWLRRWIPVAACLTIGTCVLAVQAGAVIKLRREIQASSPAIQNLDQLRQSNAQYKRLLREYGDLETLHNDYVEAVVLRNEVAQLRIQFDEVKRLRGENANLRLQLPALVAKENPIEVSNLIDEAKAKATHVQCVNNLKRIGLSMHSWASKHNDEFPASWDEIREELQESHILICPGDENRKQYLDLEVNDIQQEMTSYKFYLTSNEQKTIDQMQIIAKCTVHSSFCLGDGSAHRDLGNGSEKMINGRMTYVRFQRSTNTQ